MPMAQPVPAARDLRTPHAGLRLVRAEVLTRLGTCPDDDADLLACRLGEALVLLQTTLANRRATPRRRLEMRWATRTTPGQGPALEARWIRVQP